jgi:hypothetical protein
MKELFEVHNRALEPSEKKAKPMKRYAVCCRTSKEHHFGVRTVEEVHALRTALRPPHRSHFVTANKVRYCKKECAA